jgi:hypothetical protein
MYRTCFVLVAASLLLASCGVPEDPEEGQAIRMVIDEFNAALSMNKLEVALPLLDASTLDMYQGALDEALTLDRSGLQQLDLARELLILNLRHQYSANDLAEMDAAVCFSHVFQNFQATGVRIPPPGKVVVDGDQAYTSDDIYGEQPTLYFVKEEGAWRFQFSKLNDLLVRHLEKTRDGLGWSDEKFALSMIAASYHHPPNVAILDGPLDHRMATIERDGWSTDYPGEPIALDEPERFSRPSPTPGDLKPGQEVEVLFRVLEDGVENPFLARREALLVEVESAETDVYFYSGTLRQDSGRRSELSIGQPVTFFASSVLATEPED